MATAGAALLRVQVRVWNRNTVEAMREQLCTKLTITFARFTDVHRWYRCCQVSAAWIAERATALFCGRQIQSSDMTALCHHRNSRPCAAD